MSRVLANGQLQAGRALIDLSCKLLIQSYELTTSYRYNNNKTISLGMIEKPYHRMNDTPQKEINDGEVRKRLEMNPRDVAIPHKRN